LASLAVFFTHPLGGRCFYDNQTLINKNIVLDWYPVGTGAYMMKENNPNKQIVLVKNPNFRDEFYQHEKIPQIEKAVFTLEKESIPAWNKFLQGYYDASGLSSDNFATAIQSVAGQSEITPNLQAKGISLIKEVELSTFYWGFNMHDEVVGGLTEKAQKIRQAIGIAMNVEEYISIFLNERGVTAQFILPPGIFGYETKNNPYLFNPSTHQRKTIEDAKTLLKEAGYPNGRDAKTNEPLIIHFDTTSSGGAQNQARDNWTRKQFKKLGIDLDIRTTDYNRFREKLNNGTAQFFFFGWSADYPDPENFLFLLYGPNGKVHHDGVNSTNYDNQAFNRLYEQMILLPDHQERQDLINAMREIAEQDAPMVWGFNPESYSLKHAWLTQVIPNQMLRNGLKYYKIDGVARAKARQAWNQPRLWPLAFCLFIIVAVILPLWLGYRQKENTSQAKRFK
jgi:oligopeptide transport system substrate-binding protein